MELWAMAAVLAAASGLALIAIGVRGRRIDRHPLCLACGFDLIGRPTGAPRCPECGADVSGLAIRIGHRAPRTRPLYAGVAMFLPALLVVAAMMFVYVRGVDVTQHKPTWWLLYELDGGGAATEAAAFAELATRMQKRSLADDDVRSVAEHCLTNHGRAYVGWSPAWGSFIEAARESGKLSDEQWARYADRSVFVKAHVPAIDLGDRVIVRMDVVPREKGGGPFIAQLEVKDVHIDGRRVDTDAAGWTPLVSSRLAGGARARLPRYIAEVNREAAEKLPMGQHELRATVVLTLSEDNSAGHLVATRTDELHSRFEIRAPSARPTPATASKARR